MKSSAFLRIASFALLATALVTGGLPFFANTNVARAAGDTWTVDPVSTGLCDNTDRNCSTIQDAVAQAGEGDTISVAAGAYVATSTITITQANLTINGAQAGVDARTRSSASESVVLGLQGSFSLMASGIVIDGFTIEGATGGQGAGIATSPLYSGYVIKNNIIRNNVFGIYLHSEGTTETVVTKNLIDSNNNAGAANGNGTYSDQGTENILVDANKFTGNLGTSVNFSYAGVPNSDITISNNQMVGDGAIFALKVTDLEITNNTITNPLNHGMHLEGNTTVAITGNTITNVIDGWSAIRLHSAYSVGENSGVTISNNTMTDGATGLGVNIAAGGLADTLELHNNKISGHEFLVKNSTATEVDAESNWWGFPSSTLVSARMSGPVDFDPRWRDAAMTILSGASLSIVPSEIPALVTAEVFYPSPSTAVSVSQPVTINVSGTTGTSTIALPNEVVITEIGGGSIDANDLDAESVASSSISNLFATIDGVLKWGIPNVDLGFSQPLAISMAVDSALNGQTLEILRSVTGSSDWTSNGVSGTCVVASGMCSFTATRSGYYAAFHSVPVVNAPSGGGGSSPSGGGGGGGAPSGTTTTNNDTTTTNTNTNTTTNTGGIQGTATGNGQTAGTVGSGTEVSQGQVLGASIFSFRTNLRLGMKNSDVMELQKELKKLGFFKVTPTGYFGPITLASVKAYQKSRGIIQTGYFGPLTRAAINAYLAAL